MGKFRNSDRVEASMRENGKWYPGRYILFDDETGRHFVQADGQPSPKLFKYCRPIEDLTE